MVQSESCEGCSQSHDCKKVYEHLGCSEGPPITRAVLMAFLVPILVFVTALLAFASLVYGRDAEADRPGYTAIQIQQFDHLGFIQQLNPEFCSPVFEGLHHIQIRCGK